MHNQQTRSSKPIIALVVVLALALVVCAGLIAWRLVARGHTEPVGNPTANPTATVTTTQTTTTTATPTPTENPLIATDPPVKRVIADLTIPQLPQLPTGAITVNGGEYPRSVGNTQKIADDVAAGNVDAIVANCWTQPADEVRAVYGSPNMRGAILQALTQPLNMTQGGAYWPGTYVSIIFFWEELQSSYPCPSITWSDDQPGLGDLTPTMAQWRITRILAVQDGRPIHAGDGVDYSLLCDQECDGMWLPHDANLSYDPAEVTPIRNATATQWDRLRQLSKAHITVEQLSSNFLRVRAVDGSTDAVAYFTDGYSDFWLPCTLGEID